MLLDTRPRDFNSSFDVVGCILEASGRILQLRRALHKPKGGMWGLPAGKVGKYELLFDALIREVKEETGYTAAREKIHYVRSFFVRWPEYDFVYHMFYLSLDGMPKVILSPDEHDLFSWDTPAEAITRSLVPDGVECIKLFYGLP